MIKSYCGIDCGICDLYINKQCPGCLKSEEKRRGCRVPECVTERNLENCLVCIRIDYCKKRRKAIGECLVFLPRRDITSGRPYLIEEVNRDEAFNIFFRQVYDGADGLIVHFDPLEERWEYILKDVKTIEGITDLKEIQKTVSKFVEEQINPRILIDKLKPLEEGNLLPAVLEFLAKISKKATTKNGIVFIIIDLEAAKKDRITRFLADMHVESMLKAMSNPQRKDILQFLGKRGKSSFRDLLDEFDYYIPSKLSFHLKLLKDTGILEQDNEGTYYISSTGREFDKLIDKMATLSASNIQLYPTPDIKTLQDHGAEGYSRYMRAAKKRGNLQFVNLIKDIEKSLDTYYGEKQTKDVLLTTLGDYIKSEKAIDKKGLKRLVSEIVFVHLGDTMPLDKAISWADEMIKEHSLNF